MTHFMVFVCNVKITPITKSTLNGIDPNLQVLLDVPVFFLVQLLFLLSRLSIRCACQRAMRIKSKLSPG